MLKDVLHSLYSGGWIANLVVGIALFLILSGAGALINTPRSRLYGAALGITILFWVVILTIGNRMTSDVSNPAKDEVKVNSHVPQGDPPQVTPSSQSDGPLLPRPANSSAAVLPIEPTAKNDQAKELKSMPKNKAPSIDNRITNSPIINSPNSVQAPGGNVTINQAPPSRSLTNSQTEEILRRLREWPPVNFEIIATVGDSEIQIFAEEIHKLLRRAAWNALSPVGQFFPTGDRPIGLILTIRDQTTAKGAAVFQSTMESFGFHAPGLLDSSLPTNTVHIIVGHRE